MTHVPFRNKAFEGIKSTNETIDVFDSPHKTKVGEEIEREPTLSEKKKRKIRDNPVHCSSCNVFFVNPSDLEKHNSKHQEFNEKQQEIILEDTQFRCYCDCFFLREIDMKNHVANVHEGKKLEFVPTEVSDLNRKVENMKYRCHCKACYLTQDEMKRHVMYFHQG